MRTKHFIFFIGLILSLGLITQCEKYGKPGGDMEADPDSDRPAWAGGNTDDNIHSKGNDDSGTTRGGEYGDLYELWRDVNGVPYMIEILNEYYVQPVDGSGTPLELNEEGELVDATQATEVEFGRLNIVRSPESVLDQAFNEAMKVLGAPGAVISLDFCGRLTSTYSNGDETVVKTIDSPRESMALYRHIMRYMFGPVEGGINRLAFLGEPPYNYKPLMIAASCFAAGSDKTGTINLDEVVYINGFMDCIGLYAIPNENEHDFNNEPKYYFNFGNCDGLLNPYIYDRATTYKDRYIQFLVWDNEYFPVDENGDSDGPVYSILDFMEGTINGIFRFTHMWTGPKTHVEGFALACDDAVQVLDFVHEDSNVRFLPDYVPPPGP